MTDGVVQFSDFRNSARRCTPDETRSGAAHELQLSLRQAKTLVSTLLRTDVDWDDETRKESMTRLDHEIDGIAATVESRLSAPEELERGMVADAGSRAAFDNPMGVVALSNVLEAALVLGAARGNSIRHLLTRLWSAPRRSRIYPGGAIPSLLRPSQPAAIESCVM